MKLGPITWRDIYGDSSGEMRGNVDAVFRVLSDTDAGREFIKEYERPLGVINPDRRIFCRHVHVLSKGLREEGHGDVADLISLIKENVAAVRQAHNGLRAYEGENKFDKYKVMCERLGGANFLPDKKFLTAWFFECSSYDERRTVMTEAVKHRVFMGVECFKTLVYDCSSDDAIMEVKFFMRKLNFIPDDRFFLFCLRNCRDEVSKISAIVSAYEGITGKSKFEFFKSAFLKCDSDIEFDWIFSIMRTADFRLTDQFFIDCILSANSMNKRAVIHSIHLQRVGFKPSKAFFDAWRGVVSGDTERDLVEKYASARR